ncbi:MAG: F0F1 ATP synthase subunit delta [Polyangiales bacterium]
MSASNVARRYAKALIEIGQEQGNLDALVAELGLIAGTINESAELRAVIDSPEVPRAARKAVLVEIGKRLGLGRVAINTLSLLADNHRLRLVPSIAIALRDLADARSGVLRAKVTSASPLTETYVLSLTHALETRFQKKVVVEQAVDPTLLSGVVTRVGDTVIDGSLKSRLAQLHAALIPS